MSVRKESRKAVGIDIALGKLGGAVLGREQYVDPFVDSVIGNEIVDETIASLGDRWMRSCAWR